MCAPRGKTGILLTLALAAGVTVGAAAAVAQPPPGGGPGRGAGQGGGPPALPDSSTIEQMVEEMADAVALTDMQKDRFAALHFAHFAEVADRMETGRPDRSEMEKLRTAFENDLKDILADDQVAAYEEYVESRQPPGGGGGRRR